MQLLGRLMITAVLLTGLSAFAAAQDIEYWTGGAGMESRELAPDHNTAIQFFAQDGSFLSEIWFTLYDANGEQLIQGMTSGPWLVADLPDGEYSLRAQRMATGDEEGIRFTVSNNRSQLLGVRFPGN